MAIISETSDDGSNGGDPNKKHEELNKNPKEEDQEEEEKQNENPNRDDQEDEEEEVKNLAPIPQELTLELIDSTVALVRRCHYPKLSLISRDFRNVISSPQLYVTRSLLGRTEPVLYTLMGLPPCISPSWYILNRNKRLSKVSSLPPMNPGAAVVTIGYEMYVIGGGISRKKPTRNVFLIDCRFHTCRSLPRMLRARRRAAAGVIDGKIYVIGGCAQGYGNWIEMFDIEKQSWSSVPVPGPSPACSWNGNVLTYVVMQGTIYFKDPVTCLAYDPINGIREPLGYEIQMFSRFWHKACCVVEDLLYSIDPYPILGDLIHILVCDPNEMVWRPVEGDFTFLPNFNYQEFVMANVGGKLMLLGSIHSNFHVLNDVCCVEIALEKRQGSSKIWGTVDSMAFVHRSGKFSSPVIELCRPVTL